MLTVLVCLAIGLIVGFVLACILASGQCNTCPALEDDEEKVEEVEGRAGRDKSK